MKGSNLTVLTIGLGWLVSLGGAFALGVIASFAFHLAPGVAADSTLTAAERESEALFEQMAGEPLDWSVLRSFNPADQVPQQIELMQGGLVQLPSSAERRVLALRFFRILPPVKLRGALESLESSAGFDASKADVWIGIWKAWSERSPQSAADYRAVLLEKSRALPEPLRAALESIEPQ